MLINSNKAYYADHHFLN